jgi:hypothetical protein
MFMNKLKNYVIALTFVALFGLGACKPEPEKQKYLGNYPLGEVKYYLYFKPGSYWIYECDSTLELDSQVMISIDTPWFHKSYIDYQLLFFNRKSFTFNNSYSTDGYYEVPYNKNFNYFNAFNINIIGNNVSSYDCVFYYPFDSTKYGYGSSPTYYKGYYDSLQVLGSWYKDVRVFKVQVTSGWIKPKLANLNRLSKYASMIYYWSKQIGLIRVEVEVGDLVSQKEYRHNWNLKRYKINH